MSARLVKLPTQTQFTMLLCLLLTVHILNFSRLLKHLSHTTLSVLLKFLEGNWLTQEVLMIDVKVQIAELAG